MNKETIVIGIDHGWANMKTFNEVFTSGVKEISTTPAMFNDTLEYNGKIYKIGGKRLEVKSTKVEDENYYLLTLAAIAKELSFRRIQKANVLLAVGLPLTRFGEEKDDFIKYLGQNKEVTFRYEKRQYHVTIERISVYPQCYGAVADRLYLFPQKQLVVDIGSWTVDIMPIINRSPDESVCVTQPHGIITCMKEINKECVKQLNEEIDEHDILQVILNGADHLPDKYREIIENKLREYCQQIYYNIRELGYNMELTPITFVGGGAGVMKRYGEMNQNNISYIEDVRANARGYEYLAKHYLEKVLQRN
ncbi:MAG: ParM/StbA family protein [Lachnospiraceae bacterium]|nr:ParM/StbA family protein [Lachnospiraceae bacterium]